MSIFTKRFVVMDGSDMNVVNEIFGIIREVISEAKVVYRNLDVTHPTMKVIEFRGTKREFTRIRRKVEWRYPALCVFNPTI